MKLLTVSLLMWKPSKISAVRNTNRQQIRQKAVTIWHLASFPLALGVLEIVMRMVEVRLRVVEAARLVEVVPMELRRLQQVVKVRK
jgi:hypothetical protein